MIVDLDDDRALDPSMVGAKAAWLANGRRAGLSVLPGFVVEAAESASAIRAGAEALGVRGPGGAQLVVSAALPDSSVEISQRASRLGPVVVARSSSTLESSGRFSGAFTSYLDLAAAEAPRGVTGCWASIFSVSALDLLAQSGLEPGAVRMAVLIQPALEPECGGRASIDDEGTVTVTAVKGSPGPLLQGWQAGTHARSDGVWTGDELVDMVGRETLDALVSAVFEANHAIGANDFEWAAVDRQVWILQAGSAPRERGHFRPDFDPAYAEPEMVRAAWVVADAPGPLGSSLIVPWALGGLPEIEDTTFGSADPLLAVRLCTELTSEVWAQPPHRARQLAADCLRSMRAGSPASALAHIRGLRPPSPEKAMKLMSLVAGLRAAAVEAGAAADSESAWFVTLADVESAMEGTREGKAPLRVGASVWEPFLIAVTIAAGVRLLGTSASDGIGAGLTWSPGAPGSNSGFRPRMVVTAPFPNPPIAPLLWDATALVTTAGGTAAHLFDTARALGVPAVSGVQLPTGQGLVAVDGHEGAVSWLDRGRGE